MEFRNIKTFCTVANHSSFQRASETLHYAQSTVSAQIQALDEELGVRLFDRLGRRILLTEAGENLLNYARKLLDLEEEAKSDVGQSGSLQGCLNIRVPESFCIHRLPQAIKRFHASHPGVRLNFMTCAQEGLQADLRKGVTDLAFLFTESIQAADLESEATGFEKLAIVASRNHSLARKSKIKPADLAGQTLLLSRADCSYRRILEALLADEKVRPGVVLEFSSTAAIRECVAQGVGLSILPLAALAEKPPTGSVRILPLQGGELEVACLMIWHRQKWLSPSLRSFMDIARDELEKAYRVVKP
jgi:DNA-binding transcriptional LysR family regulator